MPLGRAPQLGTWDKPEEAASKRLSQWPLIFSRREEKEGLVSDNLGNLRGRSLPLPPQPGGFPSGSQGMNFPPSSAEETYLLPGHLALPMLLYSCRVCARGPSVLEN